MAELLSPGALSVEGPTFPAPAAHPVQALLWPMAWQLFLNSWAPLPPSAQLGKDRPESGLSPGSRGGLETGKGGDAAPPSPSSGFRPRKAPFSCALHLPSQKLQQPFLFLWGHGLPHLVVMLGVVSVVCQHGCG